VRLYPLGKPPYGRHLLPRRARKVQAKLDLLSLQSLAAATLKDGRYQHTALGYSGDVNLTVNISSGRIADISIQHEEKIDQGATTIIPQRIIDSQSLAVDGVSGATVTKDAIVTGTLEALRKAGLK
jgi:urocanate reductase